MVRFHWHVEAGLSAYTPAGEPTQDEEQDVTHVVCEAEVAGQKELLDLLFTLPADFLHKDQITLGVVLGHDQVAKEWRGKIMNELAVLLASQGYVVVRYLCKRKEARRQRMFEKALDAAATSPYCRSVDKWVLAGIGTGARVAAVVGAQCRGNIVGFVFFSYPLQRTGSHARSSKVSGQDDDVPSLQKSAEPLQKLQPACLFVTGTEDMGCPPEELAGVTRSMCSADVRMVSVPDVDEHFRRVGRGRGPSISAVRAAAKAALDFCSALNSGGLATCTLPSVPPPPPDPPVAGTDGLKGSIAGGATRPENEEHLEEHLAGNLDCSPNFAAASTEQPATAGHTSMPAPASPGPPAVTAPWRLPATSPSHAAHGWPDDGECVEAVVGSAPGFERRLSASVPGSASQPSLADEEADERTRMLRDVMAIAAAVPRDPPRKAKRTRPAPKDQQPPPAAAAALGSPPTSAADAPAPAPQPVLWQQPALKRQKQAAVQQLAREAAPRPHAAHPHAAPAAPAPPRPPQQPPASPAWRYVLDAAPSFQRPLQAHALGAWAMGGQASAPAGARPMPRPVSGAPSGAPTAQPLSRAGAELASAARPEPRVPTAAPERMSGASPQPGRALAAHLPIPAVAGPGAQPSSALHAQQALPARIPPAPAPSASYAPATHLTSAPGVAQPSGRPVWPAAAGGFPAASQPIGGSAATQPASDLAEFFLRQALASQPRAAVPPMLPAFYAPLLYGAGLQGMPGGMALSGPMAQVLMSSALARMAAQSQPSLAPEAPARAPNTGSAAAPSTAPARVGAPAAAAPPTWQHAPGR